MHSDERAALPPDVERILNGLWRTLQTCDVDGLNRRDLRAIARRVTLRAREQHLQPEALIVTIKQSWSDQPDRARNADDRKRQQAVVSEMISFCIEEFYQQASPL